MDFFTSINWSVPSWDLFIIIFFVVAALLYGLSLGKSRIIVILVSIYMALAVCNSAPFINDWSRQTVSINFGQDFVLRVSLFLGVFLILFFLLSRSALSAFGTGSVGKWWQVILFSFLHVGLLISVILSFLPQDIKGHLLPLTQDVFTSEMGRFIWITLPIAAMIVFKGNESQSL